MKITDIKIDTSRSQQCRLRDIDEPVLFTVEARLEIRISRFHDVGPISAERLGAIFREALADRGIEVVTDTDLSKERTS